MKKTDKILSGAIAVAAAVTLGSGTFLLLDEDPSPKKTEPVVQTDKPSEKQTDKKVETETKTKTKTEKAADKTEKADKPSVSVDTQPVAVDVVADVEPAPKPSPTTEEKSDKVVEDEVVEETSTPLPDIKVSSCGWEKDLVKPNEIVLACGDGNIYIDDIEWVEWTQDHARGDGYMMRNDCDPNCAAGTFDRKMVTVYLYSPFEGFFQAMSTHDGEYLYTWDDYVNTMK